ncbi:MAG: biotin/lipoyl-binding protein [Planctomycetota bacterium]
MTPTASNEPFVFDPSAAGVGQPGSTPPAGPDLIAEARREIAEILREVASASQRRQPVNAYLRFFADRVLRALAARGVVIWIRQGDDASEPDSYDLVHRLGDPDPKSWDAPSIAVHQALLRLVATDREPVIVPPTPGADQPDVPANPGQYPAAILPIQILPPEMKQEPAPEYLVEAFLEPSVSPASQRGCLRFLAQMNDLAGEFLRLQRLHDQQRFLDRITWVDQQCQRLDACDHPAETHRVWIDSLADLITTVLPSVTRVSLCRIEDKRVVLLAVAYVDRFDPRTDAADAIRDAADKPMQCLGRLSAGLIHETASAASNAVRHADHHPRWVLGGDSDYRIVCGGDADLSDWDQLTSMHQAEHDGLARLIDRGAQCVERLANRSRWPKTLTQIAGQRRSVQTTACMVFVALLLVLIPVPRRVAVSGVIRPETLDVYHAPESATVETIHVRHGQSVQAGDLLVTLSSSEYRRQMTRLVGRRSVLRQRSDEWKRSLMSSQSGKSGSGQAFHGSEIEDEIEAIDHQLRVLQSGIDDLSIRARCGGRVEAWRTSETLAQRPVNAGQVLLRVMPQDCKWVVDAMVPSHRINHVTEQMHDQGSIKASVKTAWELGGRDQSLVATTGRLGPVAQDPVSGTPMATVRFDLTVKQPGSVDTQRSLIEAPAEVLIDCGRTALGWMLIEDVVQTIDRRWDQIR